MLNNNEILKCLGLDHADIDTLEVYHEPEGLVIELTLNPRKQECPVCSSPTSRIKGYQMKVIRHSIFNQTGCIIRYRARRYICPACRKTFYESNPFAYKGSTISLATVFNVLEDLRNPSVTFTMAANKHNISPSSVAAIFDRHVSIPRRPLSECISFDETYAFKSKDSSYICVILDCVSKNIIDILPTRRKSALSDYFFSIPLEEREKVKYVSFDMWELCKSLHNSHYVKFIVM